ncbi:NAD-dependent epimerase/dehydratase family protein [Roseobacteraceae bacterium S113]
MGALTLLITGAAGFIGRAVVAEARAQGHGVIAHLRDAGQAPGPWVQDNEISVIAADLSAPDDALRAALARADVVIHCAAALTGDVEAQTRAATQGLLDGMPKGAKLVHLSSIAVYDFHTPAPGTILDESAALEPHPDTRDAYARAKIAQEEMVRAAGLDLTILRPGAVFGPGRLWNAHLGRAIGPILLRLGHRGQIPLAHIGLTARACIAAAKAPATEPINVLDDDLPDRARYLNALTKGPKLIVPLPQALFAPLLSAQTRAARFKPLGFDNARMREGLDVHQTHGFEALMHQAQEAGA